MVSVRLLFRLSSVAGWAKQRPIDRERFMRIIFGLFLFVCTSAYATDYDAVSKSFRATLADLVKADTTNPPGNEARAVKILAARLKKAGIPYEVVSFAPGRENLVARLKGSGEK